MLADAVKFLMMLFKLIMEENVVLMKLGEVGDECIWRGCCCNHADIG